MDKARNTAVHILHEVHNDGAYANVALVKHLRRDNLSEQDRRFVTELVYGAVKAGDTLDWILRRYINRPLKKIPPMVREILRLGIYQLFYLDKVPASATCNTSVELTKKYSHAGTVKFVNAVLRTAAREPERARFPEARGQEVTALALAEQHPEWLVRRWVKSFGLEETRALCKFDNGKPKLTVRTNTLRTTPEDLLAVFTGMGINAERSRLVPEGIIISEYGALDELAPLRDGLCQVQDESSMLVAHVLAPQPGDFVIDCCSAPGGKTTHIAALMENCGHIIAGDVFDHKLARVRDNANRLGIDIIETRLIDARAIGDSFTDAADRVLVDAPCSGLGVLRRKPDARWNKKESEIAKLPEQQLEILQSAARAVKPGGSLVYSTCTIEATENVEVVKSFLQQNQSFKLENTGSLLPLAKRVGENMVQLYPQRDGIDGFFIAKMIRCN